MLNIDMCVVMEVLCLSVLVVGGVRVLIMLFRLFIKDLFGLIIRRNVSVNGYIVWFVKNCCVLVLSI